MILFTSCEYDVNRLSNRIRDEETVDPLFGHGKTFALPKGSSTRSF